MALTTLSKVKSHLGMKESDTQFDAKVTVYLDAASDAIESMCQRKFAAADYTELFHGNRGDTLVPFQYPINSIDEIRVDYTRTWTDPSTLIDATAYGFSTDGLAITRYTGIWPLGKDNIRVVYNAGYTVIPNDLQLAVLWLTEWYYLHNNRRDQGRTSISKGDESVSILASMPPMIREIIARYKRVDFPSINLPVRNP